MKVLVVDDEADVQPLFTQRFRKEIKNGEIEFSFALSGEEALNYLHQHDSEIVLILSDINMPGMSGLDLLKQIRQEHEAAPPYVMMITAYADEENHNQAMQNGANDFLTKPVDFNSLKEKLKRFE
ncbi:response regulator [uncultured Mucilaginibacter sp.]|uniref:response regulator n=1 Tax=uncultured Mucilaginibacter sp. TaxID=797541 RepID=UPI002635719F|nr:response regulator [uncultured Mucilaginibacter sp.]